MQIRGLERRGALYAERALYAEGAVTEERPYTQFSDLKSRRILYTQRSLVCRQRIFNVSDLILLE